LKTKPSSRLGTASWHFLAGCAALGLWTLVGLRLHSRPSTAELLYLVTIVLVSLWGDLVVSMLLSLVAVLCLNVFFPPRFQPFNLTVDVVAILAFATTAFVITRLVATLRQSLRELRRRETYLAEQARLLDLTHDSILVRDMNNVITYWNLGAEELYGWTAEETVGKVTTHQLLHTAFPGPLEEIDAELLRDGRWEGELVHTRADGTRVVVESRWALQSDSQGNPVAVLEANTDITRTRQAAQVLQRQANLLEQSHDAIFVWEFPGTIVSWYRGAERLYGFSREEAVGRLSHQLLRTEHPMATADFEVALERDGQWTGELAHTTRAGRQIIVESVHVLMRDADGRRLVLETNRDITHRKRAEETIRQQELELRLLFDLTPQHVVVFGPDHKLLRSATTPIVNQAVLDYHGLTLEGWLSSDPDKLFHPDDWDRLTAESESHFSAEPPPAIEARLRRHDGTYRWFLFRLNPLRDDQGFITRWYVAATDIEDRKQAEQRLQDENVALREEIDKASMFEEIVGGSPPLQAVLVRVAKVAPTDSTVLITGETGTGKELFARAIHKGSPRAARAFVSVNCAAVPPSLIASELFGHEKGAFTGALQRRLGRFELAEGGTIFLDEIGELPLETQVALLHVLQEREFERVGGSQTIHVDVRVIAATNRDLGAAIAAGTFRNDLFYRLNVFPIEAPALRERRGDIPVLVSYFIDRFASRQGKKIRSVAKESLDLLQAYDWPGNIRELQNLIERSVIVCETETLRVDESWLVREGPTASQALTMELTSHEKELIEAALTESRGRVSGPAGAAARLGVPPSTLESKIRALRISKHRFKAI
jgi:formate hydrogenlyase transcriptional activator